MRTFGPTSYRLNAYLAAAVSSALGACSIGAPSAEPATRNGPTFENGTGGDSSGTGGETSGTGGTSSTTECVTGDVYPSLVAGLNPKEPTDFVGIVEGNYGLDRTFTPVLTRSAGIACDRAIDVQGCKDDYAKQVSTLTPSRFEKLGYYYLHFVITDANGSRVLASDTEVRSFLGEIDTPNEAGLLVWLGGDFIKECSKIRAVDEGYAVEVVRPVGCTPTDDLVEITVLPNGSMSEAKIGTVPSGCNVGRLTADLVGDTCNPNAAKTIGEYFVEMGQLESSAALAFLRLSRELSRLNAPSHFVDAALRSAKEELGHAQIIGGFALAEGLAPQFPFARQERLRSLFEIALENAAEGCVRELFGAACVRFQSEKSGVPAFREAFAKIAEEETRHAEWSLALHEWALTILSPDERAKVEAARRSAIEELENSLDGTVEESIRSCLGVPSKTEARHLFEGLRPLFAKLELAA